MKKLFLFILVSIMLTAMCSAAPQWIFDNNEAVDMWTYSGTEYQFSNGILLLNPENRDPIMQRKASADEAVECSEYPYVAITMKVETDAVVGGLFFATDKNPNITDACFSQFDLKTDGEWHEYIIDMSSYNHKMWDGKLQTLRLDPQNTDTLIEGDILIGRIGLFKTEKDALDFTDGQTIPDFDTHVDEITWLFNGGDDEEGWALRKLQKGDFYGLENYVAQDEDVMLIYNFKSKYDARYPMFKGEAYPYVAVRYCIDSQDGNTDREGAIFFATEENTTVSSPTYSRFEVTADGEYHNTVINMNDYSHKLWKGYITTFRLDLLNPAAAGESFRISRVGIFKTESEARHFLSEEYHSYDDDYADYSKSLTYKMPDSMVIIPANTFSNGDMIGNYILGDVGEYDSDYVVTYTDSEGKSSIVPFSDINLNGYVRYVANKGGEYSLQKNEKTFGDISSHWAKDYIEYLSAREVFGGTSPNEFSPDLPITRGMLITAIGRMHGADVSAYDGNAGYSDVNPDEYYAPYVCWAKDNEIYSPEGDLFLPEQPITRALAAYILKNCITFGDIDIKTQHVKIEFNDIGDCPKEHRDAIEFLGKAGVVNGAGEGRFHPDGMLTRAEAATVFSRFIKAVVGASYVNTFDRDRFLIGAFGVDTFLYNEESVRAIADFGADMVVSGAADVEFLNLMESFNLPYMPSNRFPFWYGDDGSNAGQYNTLLTVDEVEEYMNAAAKSEIIVGDYIVDEPNSKDFEAINEVFLEYSRLSGHKILPFINLYPNYASVLPSAASPNKSQLGNVSYAEHIADYVEHLDLDYICFDNYPFTSGGHYNKYLQNLDEVAAACRDNDKDMWVIMQTGAWNESSMISQFQIEWQMYICMAYGTDALLHACYKPYWWNANTSCVNNNGELNPTYYLAKNANEEIHAFSDVFMQYDYIGTYAVGYTGNTSSSMANQLANQNSRNAARDGFDGIDGIEVSSDAGCMVGCFEGKENSIEKAVMLVNCRDPQSYSSGIKVEADIGNAQSVTAYIDGEPTVFTPQNGIVLLTIPAGEGVFMVINN